MSGGPKSSKDDRAFELRDIVLGKIKGFPPWPAMIVDPEEVPASVTGERPTGKKYYCVRFFPAGDFAWLTARDVQPLPKSEIEKFIGMPKGVKRNSDLLNGYKIALDPSDWESTINEVIAKKQQQQSGADDDDDAEMDDDDDASKKKKRRRSDGGNGGANKKRRTSKAGKISAETVESEDEADGVGDASVASIAVAAGSSTVATKKKEKDEDEKYAHLKNDKGALEIKQVRHQLQKMFLSKSTPTAAEVEKADGLFKELEASDIPLDYLGYSKIGKVMRHIGSLGDNAIPRESEFKFKERAGDLVRKWFDKADKENGAAA